MPIFKRLVIPAIIAATITGLDQLTKALILNEIPYGRGFEVIPGFLNLVHARNPGAAFGMLADLSPHTRTVLFSCISAGAMVIITFLVVSSQRIHPLLLIGYGLFFGGVLGNLIDRIRFGEVIDFIDVHVGAMHWPAFNIADSSLCVATGIFFVFLIWGSQGSGLENDAHEKGT